MGPTFEDSPYWRPIYAPTVSNLLGDIPTYYKVIEQYVNDTENENFVEGFTQYYRLNYLTECNIGENTGTQNPKDTEQALIEKESSKISRNYRKTKNLAMAIEHMFSNNLLVDVLEHELSADLAKELNKIIGKDLFKNAGVYRMLEAKPSGYAYAYLAPHQIEEEMEQLFKEVNTELCDPEKKWYDVAAKFLIRFLYIHPFPNGNGRTARLLVSAVLKNYSLVPVSLFSSGFSVEQSNKVYLNCLDEVHSYKNYALITSLIIESTFNTLEKFLIALDLFKNRE